MSASLRELATSDFVSDTTHRLVRHKYEAKLVDVSRVYLAKTKKTWDTGS